MEIDGNTENIMVSMALIDQLHPNFVRLEAEIWLARVSIPVSFDLFLIAVERP